MKKYISIGQLRLTLVLVVVFAVIAVVVSLGAFVAHPKIEAAYNETKTALQEVLTACEDRVSQGANIRSFVLNHQARFDAQAIHAFNAARDAARRARAYQVSSGEVLLRYWNAQQAYKEEVRLLIGSSMRPPYIGLEQLLEAGLEQLLEASKSADKAVEAARLTYNVKVKVYDEARSGLLATLVAYVTQYEARPLLE